MKRITVISLVVVFGLAILGATKSHAADIGGLKLENGPYNCDSGNSFILTNDTLTLKFSDGSQAIMHPLKKQDMEGVQQWANKDAGVQLLQSEEMVTINYGHGADETCGLDTDYIKQQNDNAPAPSTKGKWKLFQCQDGGIIEIGGNVGDYANNGEVTDLRFKKYLDVAPDKYSVHAYTMDGNHVAEMNVNGKMLTVGFVGGGMMYCQAN